MTTPKHLSKLTSCGQCPLRELKPITPPVNPSARLIIVGEGPGIEECDRGEFFVGRSGRVLRGTMERYGIPESDVHFTNAALCQTNRAKHSADTWKKILTCCRHRLYTELSSIRGRQVVALGDQAMYTLLGRRGITKWMGGNLTGRPLSIRTKRTKREMALGELANFKRFNVMPIFHPAYIMRVPKYTVVFRRHLCAAYALATGRMKPWKWPPIIIDPGPEMIAALRQILEAGKPVGIDVEGYTNRMTAMGIANEDIIVSAPWDAWEDCNGPVKSIHDYPDNNIIRDLIVEILTSNLPKVMQNGVYDMAVTKARVGVTIRNFVDDPFPLHAMLSSDLPHDLGFLMACESHADRWKSAYEVTKIEKYTEADHRIYNAKDTWVPLYCVPRLKAQAFKTPGAEAEYRRKFDLGLLAGQMTEWGVRLDASELDVAKKELLEFKDNLYNTIERLTNTPNINPNSNAQMSKFLYETCGAVVRHKTDSGNPALHKEALGYLTTDRNPLVRKVSHLLIKYKQVVTKELRTYVNRFRESADTEWLLHPRWNPTGAKTGRWSSDFQNIPKYLRWYFVARPGCWFIEADYSQLESRILALLANDRWFINAFAAGVDVHELRAKEIVGPEHYVPGKYRQVGKTVNHASCYGVEVDKFHQQIVQVYPEMPFSKSRALLSKLRYSQHLGLTMYQEDLLRDVYRKGYVECPFSGRRRHFPVRRMLTVQEKNQVRNFVGQGTAADIIDPAAVKIGSGLDWVHEGIPFQYHDALILEVRDLQRGVDLALAHMPTTLKYKGEEMNFPVDIKVGKSWGCMLPIPTGDLENLDVDKVSAKLAELEETKRQDRARNINERQQWLLALAESESQAEPC